MDKLNELLNEIKRIENHDILGIEKDIEKIVNTSYTKPLTVIEYEFFTTNNGENYGIELIMDLIDNGRKICSTNKIVWLNIHKLEIED